MINNKAMHFMHVILKPDVHGINKGILLALLILASLAKL